MYCGSYSTFISHIKRHHKLSLEQYLIQCNYKLIVSDYKKCNFCGKEAEYDIQYDVDNKTYSKKYSRYFCNTLECKDKICQQFFNKPYQLAKKEFDCIGGKTEYLCKIYNTDKEGLKKIGKSKAAKNHKNLPYTLDNCISKWGIKLGTQKYFDRNRKIAYSQSLSGHINRYGKELGTQKYLARLERISQYHINNKKCISKGQLQLFNLINVNNDYELEYYTEYGIIDIYNKTKNIIIEYYGDYWHCNPTFYSDDYYNQNIKMLAKEKHIYDKQRINLIKNKLHCDKVIIIWENSFLNIDNNILFNQITNFINNDKKGILWI